MKFLKYGIFAAALSLAACSSVGTQYNVAAIDEFVVGKTTIEEAIEALGEPAYRSSYPDGSTLLQWTYTSVVLSSAKGTYHGITFDKNGVMMEPPSVHNTNIN